MNLKRLSAVVVAACLIVPIGLMAQPNGKGKGFGPNNNPARVTPKPTPPVTITVGKRENTIRIACETKAKVKG
jgi:hypothetical protein